MAHLWPTPRPTVWGIDFLLQLSEALERHYGGELKRHCDALASAQRASEADDSLF